MIQSVVLGPLQSSQIVKHLAHALAKVSRKYAAAGQEEAQVPVFAIQVEPDGQLEHSVGKGPKHSLQEMSQGWQEVESES